MTNIETTVPVKSDKTYEENNKIRMDRLSKERKVGVLGNPLYKQFLGPAYTFLYQGNPVTIVFDGTTQEYPETIAKLLIDKLNASANANTKVEMGDGDKL